MWLCRWFAHSITRRKVVRTCASTLRSRAAGGGQRRTLTSRHDAGAGTLPLSLPL